MRSLCTLRKWCGTSMGTFPRKVIANETCSTNRITKGKIYTVVQQDDHEPVLYTLAEGDDGKIRRVFKSRFRDYISNDIPAEDAPARGAKYDAGKLLFRPLMRGLALPLKAVAAVLSYGAQKYAEDSWQEVPNAKQRYEDAYYRHMVARNSGQVYDEESGLSHRAHELCNLMFLLYFDIKDGTIGNIDKFNPPPKR